MLESRFCGLPLSRLQYQYRIFTNGLSRIISMGQNPYDGSIAHFPDNGGSVGRSRSKHSLERQSCGLEDACTIEQAVKAAEVVVSECPPHAALPLAREIAADGFGGIYVDANAISPATAPARRLSPCGGRGLPATGKLQESRYAPVDGGSESGNAAISAGRAQRMSRPM
jgi:hypothetical protein